MDYSSYDEPLIYSISRNKCIFSMRFISQTCCLYVYCLYIAYQEINVYSQWDWSLDQTFCLYVYCLGHACVRSFPSSSR